MSWKQIKDILSWLGLGCGLAFVSMVFIGEAYYPAWRGFSFPWLLGRLCLFTGSLTLFLAIVTLPRWQSFVAWLCLLAVVWLAIEQ